ncbi:collagen-like protein [Draconibacterium halophilum]|uniref:Collagen-like protein n=1 Tax=Draconibacterium halophilum TaxID=2706887 RepID=A0A6C0R8I3_9BACT|nr:collagen-like protein [Draconibacterium halophilum]QIA06748.1 collagen-like protein [Draconibacterium halophilum]
MKTIEKKQTITFRKISAFLLIIVAGIFASCEGPVGPPGMPGEDGYNFVGTTFEFTGDFTPGNNYQMFFNFEDNGFDPYESDVILAYILWTNEDGLDFWRPLPQTEYFPSGAILEYNFDFTGDIPNERIVDMSVFLGGDVDLASLSTDYTLDQTFRVVVVPSDFISLADVNANDLNSILNSSNIQLKSLGAIEPGSFIDTSLEIK